MLSRSRKCVYQTFLLATRTRRQWRPPAAAPCMKQSLSREGRGLSTVAPSAIGFDDYDSMRKQFSIEVPQHYNFATDVIDEWAKKERAGQRASPHPAFWWVSEDEKTEVKWTFQQISDYSKRVANILVGGCNLQRGDRVLAVLPKVPEWWLLNIAAIRAGVVLIPGTVMLREGDIKHRLEASGAKCIIVNEEVSHLVDKVIAETDSEHLAKIVVTDNNLERPGWLIFKQLYEKSSEHFKKVETRSDEPMTLFFTSGTTGAPKMTEHTHASYGLGHLTTRLWLDAAPQHILWNMSDPGWAKSAYSNVFGPWHGGSCVFIHEAAKFDPEHTLSVLEKYPIRTFCSAPTAYRMMVLANLDKYKFPALEHCMSAGEPLNPEITDVWKSGTGQVIREGYGQTETTLLACSFRCLENKPGSMGKPCPGYDIQVIDDEGNELEPGKEGDIAVNTKPHRPVGLFSRYVDEPERTANSYNGDFYLPGDRAIKDEDGYLWFVGRSDDVINSAGYRIGPFEVESALIEHPAVAESAVVSSPDHTRGEVVKAFVILTEQHKNKDKQSLIQELQAHVKNTTAPYKYPRKIEFVDELPMTVSRKIRRVELREREWKNNS